MTAEGDYHSKKLPAIFFSTFFSSGKIQAEAAIIELGVELDRGQRVCVYLSLVHPHLRSKLAATSSTRVLHSALYVVRPVYLQQAARNAPIDRRRPRHDNLPTNHSLRTQHDYPQTSLSPSISCTLPRLPSHLYYPLVTTIVLSFPLGSSRLRLHRNTA